VISGLYNTVKVAIEKSKILYNTMELQWWIKSTDDENLIQWRRKHVSCPRIWVPHRSTPTTKIVSLSWPLPHESLLIYYFLFVRLV